MAMDQRAWPNRTTPLQSVWSMALSAVMVECERFILYMEKLRNNVVSTMGKFSKKSLLGYS